MSHWMRRGVVPVLLLSAACNKEGGADKKKDEKSDKAKSGSIERQAAVKEAQRNLGNIEAGSKNIFQQESDESGQGTGPFVHRFCPTSKTPVPAKVPAKKAKAEKTAWDDPTWVCLKFAIDDTQWCQYSYESNGKIGVDARYTATAVCDPDGDGKLVKVVLKGKGDAGDEAKRESLTTEGE